MASVSDCQLLWILELLNSYATDARAQKLLTQLALHNPDAQGYSLNKGLIRYKDRIWAADNAAMQSKLISALHDSAVGGYSGGRATYQRIKGLYYWPGMKRQIEEWIKQCLVYQQEKHEHSTPAGLLQPFANARASVGCHHGLHQRLPEILELQCHSGCLRSPNQVRPVANLFMDSVIKLHGVPLSTVSDRDKISTSNFCRKLFAAVGTKLCYSTAYNPQTDGLSEHVN
jgi:hypothetical protein